MPRLAVLAWTLAGVCWSRWRSRCVRSGRVVGPGAPARRVLSRGGGDPLGPLLGSNLMTHWQLNAIAVAVLVLAAAAYLTGVALVPVGRRVDGRYGVRVLPGRARGLGVRDLGSIAVYDQVLFAAHMAGHLALVMVAPALLVGGHPLALLLRQRRRHVATGSARRAEAAGLAADRPAGRARLVHRRHRRHPPHRR